MFIKQIVYFVDISYDTRVIVPVAQIKLVDWPADTNFKDLLT